MAEKSTNSYKKLVSNTIIFAIGQFSSKILVLLLVPIYTYVLTQTELGVNDVIVQLANWLIPIFSLSISESITRFGLDNDYDKKSVFTIGTIINLLGLVTLGVFVFFLSNNSFVTTFIDGYAPLLYIYVITSSLKLLYSYFVRALEMVKLYSICSIVTTLSTLILTILFLMIFKIGITGYLLAIILSDLVSIIFLFFKAKLWRYFDIKKCDHVLLKKMLKYCVPLIPAQLMWLITNSSDSFLTTYYLGQAKNGILAAYYKIPNIVSTIYMIFGMAWNMSAITEKNKIEQKKFYTNVFDSNQSVMYVIAGFILLLITPITNVWIGPEFRESILYSPILIIGTIFTCFTTFTGTIYSVAQRSVRALATSLIAGVINVVINIIFLPIIGLYAAAISTFCAYFIVFIIRAIDTQKFQSYDIKVKKMTINITLLIGMAALNYVSNPYIKYISLSVIFLVVLLINIKCLIKVARVVLPEKIQRLLHLI